MNLQLAYLKKALPGKVTELVEKTGLDDSVVYRLLGEMPVENVGGVYSEVKPQRTYWGSEAVGNTRGRCAMTEEELQQDERLVILAETCGYLNGKDRPITDRHRIQREMTAKQSAKIEKLGGGEEYLAMSELYHGYTTIVDADFIIKKLTPAKQEVQKVTVLGNNLHKLETDLPESNLSKLDEEEESDF